MFQVLIEIAIILKIEILSQGGETICDPYKVPQEKWIDDITLWPEVEFGEIYTYLVETPGQFTKEQLEAYKSLEAFMIYLIIRILIQQISPRSAASSLGSES